MKTIKKQTGLGLVEVLVAMLVMAVGILGYAGMQVQTLNAASDAQHRMQALALLGDMVARIRANRTQLAAYDNANFSNEIIASSCLNNDCDSAALANADIYALRQQLAGLLPNASMNLDPCPVGVTYCARIAWNGAPATAAQCDAPVLNNDNTFESFCVGLEVVL